MLVFRQFKYLQARLILNIQDELRKLEHDLVVMERDNVRAGVDLHCRQSDDHEPGRRKQIMEKIEERYTKYCECLLL